MLTQLTTVKSRLALTDATYDTILTRAIEAISARFDNECGRILARTVGAAEEFSAEETEIAVACYPIEAVTTFELRTTEDDRWLEQPRPRFLVRRACLISLQTPLGTSSQQARVTYTGGYVLPGTATVAGQTSLPPDLEQAAVEQVAFWFQKREKLGLKTYWPSGVRYEGFAEFDLLQSVREVLKRHERWRI